MAYVPNLQIENGGFTDFEGNPLALGYLLLALSHDENYSVGPNQVVGGLELRVTLDVNGNIPTSPATKVYSNDVLTPGGSFYIVRAFKADGTEAWQSPQFWALTATPDPLDVGTIVPTNPPGTGLSGGGSTLLLETNGTVNTDQSLLNIAQGTNVTITNSAGTTTISASGGPTFSTGGQGGFIGPNLGDLFPYYSVPTTFVTANAVSTTINQITAFQFKLTYSITISRVSIIIRTPQSTSSVNFGIYSAAGAKLLDSGALNSTSSGAVHNTITPVTLTPGIYFFAQSSSVTGVFVDGLQPTTQANTNMLNALSVKVGQAANSTSAGVMPATLGVLTADAVYPAVACPLFEV